MFNQPDEISALIELLPIDTGFVVGRYVSPEKKIEDTKEDFYDVWVKAQLYGTKIKMMKLHSWNIC